MGIWVRSQDKKNLLETTWLSISDIGSFCHIYARIGGTESMYIGEYKGKNEAVKVLDMIQKYIAETEYKKWKGNHLIHPFQMPPAGFSTSKEDDANG